MKEKQIFTDLSEKTFLTRLESLCVKKAPLDKGYRDKDVYVFTQKGTRFHIYKHLRNAGKTDGYIKDCLSCRYLLDEEKHINVFYRFDKMKTLLPLSVILYVVGFLILAYSVYEAIRFSNVEWIEIIGSLPFLVLGFISLRGSKKERRKLESVLFEICSVEINSEGR